MEEVGGLGYVKARVGRVWVLIELQRMDLKTSRVDG